MNDISKLILLIKNRPPLYIGEKSISRLFLFLSGYSYACFENSSSQNDILEKFQSWIQKKYNISISKSWSDIILFNSTSESAAFDTFFELFDTFIAEQVSQE